MVGPNRAPPAPMPRGWNRRGGRTARCGAATSWERLAGSAPSSAIGARAPQPAQHSNETSTTFFDMSPSGPGEWRLRRGASIFRGG